MSQNNLIQFLEPRRMMTAVIIDEPVHEFSGIAQQVRVAHLTKVNVSHPSQQLHGTADWGDGTTSQLEFIRNKRGGIDAVGTHTYTNPGTYTITDVDGIYQTGWAPPGQAVPMIAIRAGSIKTTATVDPAITETATQKFTAVIASFHQPTVDVVFTAKINWGDGTTTTGTITGDGPANGNWQVTGTHTYKRTGVYKVHTYVFSHVVGFKGPGFLFQNLLTLIHVMGAA